MEPVNRTSEDLRELIEDLDSKIGPSSDSSTASADERIIDVTGDEPRVYRRIPAWLGFLAVTLLVVCLSILVVQPWNQCSYSSDICRIAQLDIDALRVALPNSDVIAELPNIDALDPDDVLTIGEVFEMERFKDLSLERLLTDAEVEQLLTAIG